MLSILNNPIFAILSLLYFLKYVNMWIYPSIVHIKNRLLSGITKNDVTNDSN
jgi:hypothetical protein